MKQDNHNYKGWLNSDHFIKRAMATLGYATIAYLIIYAGMALIAAAIFGLAILFE